MRQRYSEFYRVFKFLYEEPSYRFYKLLYIEPLFIVYKFPYVTGIDPITIRQSLNTELVTAAL